MKKKLFFVLIAFLTIAVSVFAVDWIQIDEKTYLDGSSLSPYSYNLNYDNDKLYSIWSKMLNRGTEHWKRVEKVLGKKLWYDKNLWIINCDKKEIAIKSSVSYDLSGNVADSYNNDYLNWNSVVPETLGEDIYTVVCRAVGPKIRIKIRSHK